MWLGRRGAFNGEFWIWSGCMGWNGGLYKSSWGVRREKGLEWEDDAELDLEWWGRKSRVVMGREGKKKGRWVLLADEEETGQPKKEMVVEEEMRLQ